MKRPLRNIFVFGMASIGLTAFTLGVEGLGGLSQKAPKIKHHKIVHAHNLLRDEVDVPHIHWQHHLAVEAQKWADSMANTCTVFDPPDSKVGANMFWTGNKRSEEEVVAFWAKERKWFAESDSIYKGEDSRRFEHYSQIVWKGTKHIGAGKAKCDNGDEIWVCFYTPKGNVIGEKPF